jgi:hypothetical protein
MADFSRHFSPATRRALRKAGVRVYGLQALPDASGSFLNSTTGYLVDDNGTGRVWTFAEVLAFAGRA